MTERYRDLWTAVLQQAIDDLQNEPYGSLEYTQAVAFFVGKGSWIESRRHLADMLEIHEDSLSALGRRLVAADRKARGLPAEIPTPAPKPQPVKPPEAPKLAPPLALLQFLPATCKARPQPRIPPRGGHKQWVDYNPFDTKWRPAAA